MLRNRSRALMADHNTSLLSPTRNPTTPISSFLGSPRLFFNGFLAKNISHSENNTFINSPTSILDTKNSSTFANPFVFNTNLPKSQITSLEINNKSEPEAIGLALIDSIIEEENGVNFSKPINRMALFGSKLKVQIPVINNNNNNHSSSFSPVESPKSPADFGIKTRNCQTSSPFNGTPSKDFSRQLSLKEMELSEDYTCVITHGPNPKTTHIFDDCVVEANVEASENFMSFCHTCKDIIGQGKDMYIYRGEKSICSHECCSQEMFFEGMKNEEMDDAF